MVVIREWLPKSRAFAYRVWPTWGPTNHPSCLRRSRDLLEIGATGLVYNFRRLGYSTPSFPRGWLMANLGSVAVGGRSARGRAS